MFAVRFEHVSKVYKIGRQRQFTQLFAAWAGKAVGKDAGRPKHWALNDVSFELQEGESLGDARRRTGPARPPSSSCSRA